MPYQYFEDLAPADVAFKAWGKDLAELFTSAGDAVIETMVEDLATISLNTDIEIHLEDDAEDMLLFAFLQELIFYKDAEQLLLRSKQMKIEHRDDKYFLKALVSGEIIDREKHELKVDVKTVTLHKFYVKEIENGWESFILIDV